MELLRRLISKAGISRTGSRKALQLPDVTLIGIDTDPDRLAGPLAESTRDIEFGSVRIISDVPIRSIKDYSR